ncbi:MAG: SUMF1/EgtB/PvdO family nonheme iron enzyme [Anaerolineales bacterium]|nr:SUMF1/EgtB/PvdO family nonheme iron enzyme [Anaerolineales bacterium]
MTSLIGQSLLNRFRVEEFVASGGMGVVYRVWDPKRNVPLAMKVLHADLAEDPSIFKRFRREARALQKLAHPNIVPFYGLHQTDEFAFLLERYVDGPSLKQNIRRRKGKPIPIEEGVVYMMAISAALGYAHAHGVIHCDVKPSNVMIDHGGAIYLTDFGVARHAESTTTTLGFAGTAAYMAPEQCRAEPVTAQTDVYAMGVMLFEMTTGRRPFRGDEKETKDTGSTSAERVRYAHLHISPPDPRQFNSSISEELAKVILKALAKEPTDRYQSAREFFEAVCEAAEIDLRTISERVEIPEAFVHEPKAAPTPSRDFQRIPCLHTFSENRFRQLISWVGGIGLATVAIFMLLRASGVTMTTNRATLNTQSMTLTVEAENRAANPQTMLKETSTVSDATKQTAENPANTKTSSDQLSNPQVTASVSKMAFINEGSFTMGAATWQIEWAVKFCNLVTTVGKCLREDYTDQIPLHEVFLDAFYIDRYEVTNAEYQKCVEANVCASSDAAAIERGRLASDYATNPQFANYPVVGVDYDNATKYCEWAGKRLPTEAEWERAARGDDGRFYPWGNPSFNARSDRHDLPSIRKANYCDETCLRDFPWKDEKYSDGWPGPSPVGSFPPGPYGIYDMAGNVQEWVQDTWSQDYYAKSQYHNPANLSQGSHVVTRGGGWNNGLWFLTAVNRWGERPDDTSPNRGFRCVVEP